MIGTDGDVATCVLSLVMCVVCFVNLLCNSRNTVDELENHIPICDTVDQCVAKCRASVCQNTCDWCSNTINMIVIQCWCVHTLQGVLGLKINAL